jgi:hypothetical protein
MKVQLGPIPFWSIHMSHQLFVIIVGKCWWALSNKDFSANFACLWCWINIFII